MKGVHFTNLNIYNTEKGSVYKGIKKGDSGLKQFGESYFSFINQGKIKGWKCHKKMTCNLICISGEVKIILCELDEKNMKIIETFEFLLSKEHYGRLTIPPGLWFGLKGQHKENIVLNVADIVHVESETISMDIQNPIFQNISW